VSSALRRLRSLGKRNLRTAVATAGLAGTAGNEIMADRKHLAEDVADAVRERRAGARSATWRRAQEKEF
jgi:hypothetical protein